MLQKRADRESPTHRWSGASQVQCCKGIISIRGFLAILGGIMENITSANLEDQQLSKVFKIIPNMCILTTPDLQIEKINPAVVSQLGYKEDELVNKSLSTLLISSTNIKNTLNGIKAKFVHKNGKEMPVLVSSSRFNRSDGAVSILYFLQDITELQIAEKKMLMSARAAGMDDVAVCVLHNVGNALNSVNTSVSMVRDRLMNSKMLDMLKLAELIKKHKDNIGEFIKNDPQGQKIPVYLTMLAEVLTTDRQHFLGEVTALEKNINHICQIIAIQQSINSDYEVTEQTSLPEILEDALEFNKIGYEKTEIEVVKNFEPIKTVLIDRIKLLQIIVNLIKNSMESLTESNAKIKKLVLSLAEKDNSHFTIQIADNGVGILPENLIKIFSYGFTTKTNGQGFGLHRSVLAAGEMQGDLVATSEGPDKGATFTLTLPYKPTVKGKPA